MPGKILQHVLSVLQGPWTPTDTISLLGHTLPLEPSEADPEGTREALTALRWRMDRYTIPLTLPAEPDFENRWLSAQKTVDSKKWTRFPAPGSLGRT